MDDYIRLCSIGDLDSLMKIQHKPNKKTILSGFLQAINNGHINILEYLYPKYIDINAHIYRAVCSKNNLNVFLWFYNTIKNPKKSLRDLYLICTTGNIVMFEYYINKFNINVYTKQDFVLSYACSSDNNLEFVKYLIDKYGIKTPTNPYGFSLINQIEGMSIYYRTHNNGYINTAKYLWDVFNLKSLTIHND